ncbi:MAG TPA: hypothetical protein PLP99_04800 [Ignavibacteriales bacterium]|nr:hypothetical protein [Ignavibacteriales bacterium]HOL81064.1 hypothetical protein [Ignavibacteriales bacterium]HPP32845.1 hypothetical protein [Ignavibacteriales bacterium]
MKKIIILNILLVIEIFAAGNGSPYSILGLGDFLLNPNTKIYGFGGLGYAYNSYFSVNYLNPAANSNLKLPRLEASFLYSGYNINEKYSSFYSNSNINGLAVGIPIEREIGISVAAGMMPTTTMKNVYRDKVYTNNIKFEYENNGNLSKLFIALAGNLSQNLSLGTSFDYYILDKNKISRVYNEDYNLTNAEFKTNYHFNAIGYTFGVNITNLNRILNIKDVDNATFSFVFSPKFDKLSDTSVTLRTFRGEEIGSDYSQSIDIAKGKTTLTKPMEFGIGFNTSFDEYMLGFDYRFIKTSDVQENKQSLDDYQKYVIYFEYSKLKPRNYWQTMPLRLSLSYEKTPYYSNNKRVNAIYFNIGSTLLLTKESGLDFAISYGKRGMGTNLEENIINVNIGIGFSEIWFIREEK